MLLRSNKTLTCRFMVTSSISSCLRTLTAAGPLLDIAVTSSEIKCIPLGGFFFALCRFLPASPCTSFLTCIDFSAIFTGCGNTRSHLNLWLIKNMFIDVDLWWVWELHINKTGSTDLKYIFRIAPFAQLQVLILVSQVQLFPLKKDRCPICKV